MVPIVDVLRVLPGNLPKFSSERVGSVCVVGG